jgi:small subunit ribosomal protein S5
MRNRNSEFHEKVVQIKRTSKKTKGGNAISFSALCVVGDKKGRVGAALGKAPDVASAIRKGMKRAHKNMFKVPIVNKTIPHRIEVKKGAALILLKPAPEGTGVRVGGPVRAVVEAAGIGNIVSKIMGTRNRASNVYATIEALKRLKKKSQAPSIK